MSLCAAISVHMQGEQTSFLMPLGEGLDPTNRWIKLGRLVPWHLVEETYGKHFRRDRGGHRPLTARVALGALIVKERLGLTDRETVEQIRENPYLQHFLGYGSFSSAAPFDASLMTHFRKRLDAAFINAMNAHLIEERLSATKPGSDDAADREDEADGPSSPSSRGEGENAMTSPTVEADAAGSTPVDGTLIIDATCAPADIAYPTDLKVVNQAREATERIIDDLHRPQVGACARPRTHRKRARKAFVNAVKSKKASRATRRVAVGKQLRFLRRNLRIIREQVESGAWDLRLLKREWYTKLLVATEVYRQQLYLYRSRDWSIADRIVSIAQPHVRPIVRGKAGVPVEFGAKISVSWVEGYASLDHLRWDPYHEGKDLPSQAESYRARTGRYPAVIHADKAYTTRENRAWCTQRGIRLTGIGPGRPPTDPIARRERNRLARDDEAARQPIEGIFGRAKRRWSLSRIMAKLACTAATVIALVFLVMNLEWILAPLVLAMLLAFVVHVGKWTNGDQQMALDARSDGFPGRWSVVVLR